MPRFIFTLLAAVAGAAFLLKDEISQPIHHLIEKSTTPKAEEVDKSTVMLQQMEAMEDFTASIAGLRQRLLNEGFNEGIADEIVLSAVRGAAAQQK